MVDTGPYTHDGIPVAQLFTDLVDLANVGLAQTPDGTPAIAGVFHTYVEDCCSALMLRVREWGPVNVGEFPLFAQEKKRCLPLTMTPRVVLSLRRPYAPTPDQHGNVAAADEIAFANKLLIDARALVCQVKSAWPTRLHEDYPGARIAYGAMTAQPVSGASECLGWDWEIMLEIKGCTCG